MKNKDLIERIVEYQKKWNIDIFNNMYKNEKEAFKETEWKMENHPEYLIQDFAMDVEYIKNNVSNISTEQLKEQLSENYNLLVEIHGIFFRNE